MLPDEFPQLQHRSGSAGQGTKPGSGAIHPRRASRAADALLMESDRDPLDVVSGGRARCSPILGQIAARPVWIRRPCSWAA